MEKKIHTSKIFFILTKTTTKKTNQTNKQTKKRLLTSFFIFFSIIYARRNYWNRQIFRLYMFWNVLKTISLFLKYVCLSICV